MTGEQQRGEGGGGELTPPMSVRVEMSLQVVGDSSQLPPLVDPQPGPPFLPQLQVQTWPTGEGAGANAV